MAEYQEEILYQGDPVPKPVLSDQHRGKLDSIVQQMIKNKESDSNIQMVVNDFKQKYSTPEVKQAPQPSFQVQISEPTFKSPPSQTQPKEFSFNKPYDPLAVEKLKGVAVEAQGKLHAELKSNENIHEKQVREYRRDSYNIDQLRKDYAEQGLILRPQDEQKILKLEKQKKYDAPVDVEDISDSKTGTILNQQASRKFIKNLNNPEVAKNAYLVDKYNEIANDPNGNHRVEKIKDIAKLIGKGAVIYDPEKKIAIKPLGMIGSAIEGVKNKFKAEEEHDFFKNAPDATIINQLESERNNPETDEPLNVPKGKAQEILMSLTEMPITPIVAGVAGTFGGTLIGNPELGVIAASALGAYENRKIQYQSTFKQVYNEMRDQGNSEFESLNAARKQAETAQEIGSIVGAAQGVIGAKMASTPLKFSNAYQQSIGKLIKQNANELGSLVLEGVAQGGIGAIGEVVKNKLAKAIGINREIDAGTADQFWSNMLMTVGIGAAMKAGRGMTKIDYRNILHGVSKVPDETINAVLQEKVNNGEVTQQAADETSQRINEYREKDAQIPANVTEEARFKIQDNIDKLNELEQQKEITHKSLQEPIKEKITKLEEQNLELAKNIEKPTKEESGLSRNKEREAIEFADELVSEGIIPDTYEAAIKSDPIGFWKEIAQQAQSRDSEWRPLSEDQAGMSEQAVRDQFGDTVVEYAKELFPAPEVPTSTENVSVIMPGEIRQPETIIIKPKESATTEQIANEVDVRKPSTNGQALGEGNAQSEGTAREEIPPVKEEGATPGQEGQVGEPQMVGITHKQMDALSEEWGLPKYEGSPERVAEWDQQAAKKLQQPDALNNLFNKLRNGDLPDPVETRMMVLYWGDLMAKLDKNPYDRSLQDQALRTKDIFNISGRIWGKAGAARKGLKPVEETMGDFLIRDREANKAPLTDEQITISKKEYEDIKAAKEAYEQKIAKDKEAKLKQKAESIIKGEAKKIKKTTSKDYSVERKQILDDLKKKWDSSKGQISATFVPYADRLVKIAPDVIRLMRSYVEQGITELPDVVRAIHKAIKDHIDGITENDINDIIAGVYSDKKPTRNKLAQQLYDLKKEAQLLNELEQLQEGDIPVKQDKIRQRSRRIEELKGLIKELRDEIGLNEKTDDQKLSALKARYKKQIAEIEKKIQEGDYAPDQKPEPIKLDEEAQQLKDRLDELKMERESRLAQLEYEQMSGGKKALDLASQSLDTIRTLQTNPDLSFFGRQGIKYLITHPIQGPRLFWESVKQAFSQKRYDRWLSSIHDSPTWKLIEESGLAVLDPHTLNSAKREEEWRSQLIHKIPFAGQVAKASERAFTSAANMARVDWFMEGVNILKKQGKTWENSPEEYKAWASAVNNMTGRGGLGKLEPVVGQLAIPFWSPRLIAANVNLFLNPVYYAKMPKTARIMLIKNMAQYVGTGVAFLILAKTLGADVEADPRSSDFGKIKVGNTRYDIWGGASQYIRVLSQLFKGQRKTGNEISELNTRAKVMTGANLVRTKLSPIIGFGVDALLGENVVGEKVEWGDAYKLMIPMLYNDIKEAANDEKGGPGTATVAGLLSFLGIGAQTYGGKKPQIGSSRNKSSKPQRQSKQNKTHK